VAKGRKFDPKWLGQYQIGRKISGLVYQIKISRNPVNINVEQLKLCLTSRQQQRGNRRQRRRERREQTTNPQDYGDSQTDSESESEPDVVTTYFEPHSATNDRAAQEHSTDAADKADTSDNGATDVGRGQNYSSVPPSDGQSNDDQVTHDVNADDTSRSVRQGEQTEQLPKTD
jgi:hypothetical protein